MAKRLLILALGCFAVGAVAQNPTQSFQDFRNEILGNFKEFRQTLLDDYADFLNGEWHEYRSLRGEDRYKTPKPEQAPRVEKPVKPVPGDVPAEQAPVEEPAQPTTEAPTFPSAAPSNPPTPSSPALDEEEIASAINFYGMPVAMPRIDFNILQDLGSTSDYARQWKMLADGEVASRVLPSLQKKIKDMGLNDYLAFRFVKAYIDSLFPDKDDSSRFSAIHYLLANMGYDVRIAATANGTPLLMIPFEQMVYGNTYLMIDDNKYYLFGPDLFDMDKLGNAGIYTCKIPNNLEKGKKMDLVIGELKIPYEPHKFDLRGEDIILTGEMNRNLIPLLYHYPQMDVDGFAKSNLQPALRKDLSEQIRRQLSAMPEEEAVNALLQFTQRAFLYATDEDFHGFEKPYFLEETLYYPKNDCEDRAIFYTYFLWNALGKEAQLISYPGHEAASVSISTPVEGASYTYGGSTFYISDPTYIGSTTGMVMPRYKNEKPTIDYTYK